MSSRTSRRAALGAILAAPLASVPVIAAQSVLPDHEARLLAIGPQLVALLDEYDRLKPQWVEAYEAWSKARQHFAIPQWPEAEKLPEWQAYCLARVPADAVNDRIEELYSPCDAEPCNTLPAIMLRFRYAMTFEEWIDEAMADLREYMRRHPLCA
ncbi:hypothetical protein CIW48_19860 [Methylobacterium sp. P1-11]|uniref:hypothetical protein n=1 Tax=Methylobacterium sp. P1-11 TaxID=2024616 RepID=UPI0011EBD3B9|nr:hypothetical protein [Methylobacterium sp. P1-11]KAA0122248.1 hypothetical protein CIW48_19860 [Methylobacterium sp. P1-11]